MTKTIDQLSRIHEKGTEFMKSAYMHYGMQEARKNPKQFREFAENIIRSTQ